MESINYPRIVFSEDFDERAAFEITLKGWLSAQVEVENGQRYPVFFYDPVRLQQDLEEEAKLGRPCLAEPGLIVLPEVTVAAAQQAVEFLWQRGFFTHLKAERSEGPKLAVA